MGSDKGNNSGELARLNRILKGLYGDLLDGNYADPPGLFWVYEAQKIKNDYDKTVAALAENPANVRAVWRWNYEEYLVALRRNAERAEAMKK